jgi:hypothetical protein
MKKTITKFFCLVFPVVFLLALISCSSGGVGGDREPNNTIEEAVEVNLGEVFEITIDPQGDQDYFKAEIPEQGYMKIQATGVPEGLTLEVGFSIYQEWEGEKTKWLRGWSRLPDALFIKDPGTYYFVIHDDYDDKSANEKIQIKAEFIAEFDPTEPNNSVEEAKAVDFVDLNLAIFPTGDMDWFKVTTPAQGYIRALSKNVPEGITPEIYYALYDEWADPKVQEIRSWKKLPDACFIPDSGVYYLLFHDDYDDKSSESVMDIKLEFMPEMDKYEPNYTYQEAKPVERGDTLELAVFPTGDYDYFKIKLNEGDKIKFLAKDFESVVPEIILQIINPANPNELMNVSDWKELPAEFEVSTTQEYYILLHDNYDDTSSPKLFTIRIE